MGEVILYINDDYQHNDDIFIESLRQSEYNFKSCIIIGYVQKWNGKHTIYPTEVEGILEAVYKCTDKMDDVVIKFVEDHLELDCSHHDGTNKFKIYLLSEKGSEAIENSDDVDYSKEEYHEKMNIDELLCLN